MKLAANCATKSESAAFNAANYAVARIANYKRCATPARRAPTAYF